ncbi:MAG: TadE/TadG family type IV pilus assembly protein [Acidimicrobiales bacterium]
MTSRPREGGSLTAELVVLAPVVALFALVAVGLGRYELAHQEVIDAARAAAEAASVVSSPADAESAAGDAVSPTLQGQRRMCSSYEVSTDAAAFAPGGFVKVTVSCRVALTDLLVPGFPGSVPVQATQTAPVDPYRWVG